MNDKIFPKMSNSYNEHSIQSLSVAQSIRKRPELYVGDPESALLVNRLLQEALCVSIDDAYGGNCRRVEIEIAGDGIFTVTDDGPGWPVVTGTVEKCDAERYMTVLYACSSAKHNEDIAKTVCTFGMVCINAFSSSCELTVWRDGYEWAQGYDYGEPRAQFERVRASSRHGVRLRFTLDRELLPSRTLDVDDFCEWVKTHARGLTVSVVDRPSNRTFEVCAKSSD